MAKGKSGWSFFGVSEERFENAATCYRSAAQAYEKKGNCTHLLCPFVSPLY